MTWGKRPRSSSSSPSSRTAWAPLSRSVATRSASARAANGHSHSHRVGATPGDRMPTIAASYAPLASPAPMRTRARTASKSQARNAVLSAASSSARARWSSASCCRPCDVASWAASSRACTSAATPGSDPSARRSSAVAERQSPPWKQAPASSTASQARYGWGARWSASCSRRARTRFTQTRAVVGGRGVGLPQRRVDERPPVAGHDRGLRAARTQVRPTGVAAQHRAHGRRREGVGHHRRVTCGLGAAHRGGHRVLGVRGVGPERGLGHLREGVPVLPGLRPGARQLRGRHHRLDAEEAPPRREAEVLAPHEQLGDEQRVVLLARHLEELLDGRVLDLVLPQRGGHLLEPGQQVTAAVPSPPPPARAVRRGVAAARAAPGRRRARPPPAGPAPSSRRRHRGSPPGGGARRRPTSG